MLPKSKQPQSKSYKTVQEVLNDLFILAKLKFFSFVSDIVVPLKKYQAGKSMFSFMYKVLKDLQFLKKTDWDKIKTIDLYNKENVFNVEKMSVRFAVEDEINNLKRKGLVTVNQIKMFTKGVHGFLCAMVNKLFGKKSIGSVTPK